MSGRGQFSATYVYEVVRAWNSKDGDEILQNTAVNNMDVVPCSI